MNLNEAAGCLLVKFTDGWRSGEMAHALDNRVSIEEDLVKPQINKYMHVSVGYPICMSPLHKDLFPPL